MRDVKNPNRKNNNNINDNAGGNLFPPGPGGDENLFPPGPPGLGPPPPPSVPEEYELQNRFNNLRGTSSPPPFFANNAPNFNFPAQTSSFNPKSTSTSGPEYNLFGSQAAELTREKVKDGNLITETKVDIDDTLYELPENCELELGEDLVENLDVAAGDLLDAENITKQEEEDVAL